MWHLNSQEFKDIVFISYLNFMIASEPPPSNQVCCTSVVPYKFGR